MEDHHHHRHAYPLKLNSLNAIFIFGIVVNLLYLAAEALCGLYFDSMGLLSDAGHNLSDVATLVIAMFAFKMAERKPSEKYTFGYRKMTIQASMLNALLLCAAIGAILVESIEKLSHPTAVDGDAIAIVAGCGVIVKGFTAWLFIHEKEKDLNVKGAYLHMIADAMVSVGVVISGIVIHFTNWYIIDPVIGILIAIVIAFSTRELLLGSMRLSLDGVPRHISYRKVQDAIASAPGVKALDELHVWPVSTTLTAMTVKVEISDPMQMDCVDCEIRKRMKTLGIDHCTIETTATSHTGKECPCEYNM
ncbi:MAG: cation diffusion facilitator family transporter [Muribaculum sp.]|nr:cation diffusion facilitator family transporter [Muribaculum sp.]